MEGGSTIDGGVVIERDKNECGWMMPGNCRDQNVRDFAVQRGERWNDGQTGGTSDNIN